MDGSDLSAIGIARISAAQAAGVFAGPPAGGDVIVERGIFRHPPRRGSRGPWFAWAVLEYGPSGHGPPTASTVLQPPRDPQRPLPGIRLDWLGIPVA